MFVSRVINICWKEQHNGFTLEQLSYMYSFWHCHYHVYLQLLVWFVGAFLICNCNIPLWIKMVTNYFLCRKKPLKYQENIFTALLRTEVIKAEVPLFFIPGGTCCGCWCFFLTRDWYTTIKFNHCNFTQAILSPKEKYQPLHDNCFPSSYWTLTKIPVSQPGVHSLNSP